MVEKLFQEFCSLDEVEALALGGSRAGELYDEASDYDILRKTGPSCSRTYSPRRTG